MGLMEDMENNTGNVTFVKMTDGKLIFQLTDLQVEEDYAIFDTKATDKNLMWYRNGMQITADDGTQIEVEKTQFIKALTFDKYFKGKRRTTQYKRNINVEGNPARFGFKKTANDKLNDLIKTLQATGQDPMGFKYLMIKTGEGIKTEYSVSITGKADSQPAKPVTPKPFGLNVRLATTKPKPITEQESDLMNAYKGIQDPKHKTLDVFKGIYEDNKEDLGEITEARLVELFNMC